MPSSPAPLREVPGSEIAFDHLHAQGEVCPTCEQPIPNAKLEEVKKRIEAKEQERTAEITAQLQSSFERAQAEAATKAKAALDQARLDAAAALEKEKSAATARVETAATEAKRLAEAAASEKLAAAERAAASLQTNFQTQLAQAAQATTAAEQSRDALKGQLEQARTEGAEAIKQAKQEAADREAEVRAEAKRAADAAAQEKIEGAARAHQEAEAALQEQLEATEAGKTAVEQAAAETKAELEGQVRTLSASLDTRLQEQREALEKDKDAAVNAEKSAAFEANQKLADKVTELQRALEKKTAEDLGEGAEIDLFEALQEAFDDDKIERIHKGAPGADIRHIVVHNGKECGKIIYNSKNHKQWRTEFVTKLAQDQMAEKAEHAVLSVHKFPQGVRHLDVRDGVVVANPARVVAVVHLLRKQIVQGHVLRLSNQERTQKTAALYGFITSERCTELFGRFDTHTDALLALQVKEKKAHDKMWKDQGQLVASIQKVNAEIGHEINTIIGTAAVPEQGDE